MPELPEVETIVRGLRPHLPGRIVTRVRVRRNDVLTVPARSFAAAVRHRRVREVLRRGKNVVLPLDGGSVVVVNLGMTGRLLPDPHPSPRHVALVLELDDGGRLVYDDVRRFGRWEVLDADAWAARSAALGPEPLDPAYRPEELAAALARSRAPLRSWLLDQRRIAGVGNIYANEALHLAGLHPRTPARNVAPERAYALHEALVRVLRAAIEAGGTTIRDYRNTDGAPGRFAPALRVYGRDGLPCPACGAAVRRIVFGGRSAFHCPRCQPEDA